MATRLLAALLCALALQASAAEVGGVRIPDAEGPLVLNGAGVRQRFVFDVYVLGLYLPAKKAVAAEAIGAPGPKRVLIHMLRDVPADQFSGALMDGLKDNVPAAELKALEPRLRQLNELMLSFKEAKKGMRITIDWTEAGTVVAADGKAVGAPIPGEDFYRALLRIWLGDRPVQPDLKKALLGG